MFPQSDLIMQALYEDRKREIEQILRARRAADLRATHQHEAVRKVVHWVGRRLIQWGQQLQAHADVSMQDAVAR